ncbi:MAG: bifunctional precorrin-2 dehydrogenase/sirohydrochlorin ferrochelatase [Chloroflexota bacterium]|nr:bifunctional precorrin-2 dehydrogenase/sirohydrochlorin ferrochelatase [Chloroflexota bacterium]MCY3581104.1 bifunctional precorrin-2 dehydrogenase/sirohydrochlorin ferrochelatase [Chloroflexota bacterium]MDE2650643.1 bifunctional precorrin-2 dehydrogenase/sirohydrochlorin ferrochelatase [Chloroflexota bacterium]
MASGYPVMLHLQDRPVAVVGGGRVAARKVRQLRKAGARILLISPQATDDLIEMAGAGEVLWRRESYQRDSFHSDMPVLVIAATDDPRVNQMVAQDAQRIRALCNVSDGSSQRSDFSNMAQIDQPPLTIALSSHGKSPALIKMLKARLADERAEDWATLADWLGDLRADGEVGNSQPQRQELYRRILASNVLALLRQGRAEQARQVFERIVEGAKAE